VVQGYRDAGLVQGYRGTGVLQENYWSQVYRSGKGVVVSYWGTVVVQCYSVTNISVLQGYSSTQGIQLVQ
jgi:hypothetical protein